MKSSSYRWGQIYFLLRQIWALLNSWIHELSGQRKHELRRWHNKLIFRWILTKLWMQNKLCAYKYGSRQIKMRFVMIIIIIIVNLVRSNESHNGPFYMQDHHKFRKKNFWTSFSNMWIHIDIWYLHFNNL